MDILRRLSEKSFNEVDELIKLGWKFTDDSWESGHNGDEYDDVGFKSPRMSSSGTIRESDWPTITKKELLRREVKHLASECSRHLFEYPVDFGSSITKELEKYMTKNKDCDFSDLCSEDVSIDVKISPKNKNTLKKVKVTIEIL